jgi:hypothetical protein
MRHSSKLPQDDGSRQFQRCPPSHHEMVLLPDHAQASARAPRPSPLPTSSPLSAAQVSPYHQRGSTMPLAAPAAHFSCHLVPLGSMWGECPQARLYDRSYWLMAPSPCSSAVKTPSVSKLAFYQPACFAAPLNAEVLADLKAISRDIAWTISEGHQVPNGWGSSTS